MATPQTQTPTTPQQDDGWGAAVHTAISPQVSSSGDGWSAAVDSALGRGTEAKKEPTGPTVGPPPTAPSFTEAMETNPSLTTAVAYPAARVVQALSDIESNMENYTEEGRAEHPILARVGDVARNARELLLGGQEAGKPLGTSSGVLNNPVTASLAIPETGDSLVESIQAMRAARAAKAAAKASKIAEVNEGMFKFVKVPNAMHGTPMEIEAPLDSATISREGGKGLSNEALARLSSRQGNKIPVGSTMKNVLFHDVQPNAEAIDRLATQMNDIVRQVPPMPKSVAEDGLLDPQIDELKKAIPLSEREKGIANINEEMENAEDVLNSKNLQEVLEYRRQLGRKIDWENIDNVPESPKEVINAARARIYRALGDKVHTTAPQTVALDAELQPNLELRSYYRNRLGARAVDDPLGATAEARSEYEKGKRVIAANQRNAQVTRNRAIAWRILAPLIGGTIGGGVGAEIIKKLMNQDH